MTGKVAQARQDGWGQGRDGQPYPRARRRGSGRLSHREGGPWRARGRRRMERGRWDLLWSRGVWRVSVWGGSLADQSKALLPAQSRSLSSFPLSRISSNHPCVAFVLQHVTGHLTLAKTCFKNLFGHLFEFKSQPKYFSHLFHHLIYQMHIFNK